MGGGGEEMRGRMRRWGRIEIFLSAAVLMLRKVCFLFLYEGEGFTLFYTNNEQICSYSMSDLYAQQEPKCSLTINDEIN